MEATKADCASLLLFPARLWLLSWGQPALSFIITLGCSLALCLQASAHTYMLKNEK